MFSFARDPARTGNVGSPEQTDNERRLADIVKTGRVIEVSYADPAKPRVRVGIGDPDDDEGYIKTGWLPMAGGRSDEWNPLKVGEAVTVMSEGGELQNGVVTPGSINNSERPAVGDRADLWRKRFDDGSVIEYDEGAKAMKFGVGQGAVQLTEDGITLTFGGVSLKVSAEGVDITGGAVKHDGHLIDKTHKHTQVEVGSSLSGPPP